MRQLIIICLAALSLTGCITAAEREHADDAVCANARDYDICRQGIMSSRRDQAIRSQ